MDGHGTWGQRTRRLTATVLVGVALFGSACASPPDPAVGPSPNDAPRADDPAYAEVGPYDVGVRTIQIGGRSAEVWYPAPSGAAGDTERDAYFIKDSIPGWLSSLIPAEVNPPYVSAAVRGLPVADDGPFPLVVFSHGFAAYRTQSTFLTTHLASWGFVVVSPDYLERGLLGVLGEPPSAALPDDVVADQAIRAVRSLSATETDPLAGAVVEDLVLPIGHSAGGGTSLKLLARDDVPGAVALAAGINLFSFGSTAPLLASGKAVTWIAAQRDSVVMIDDVRNGFTYTAGPARLVELSDSGHVNAFSEICEIGDGGAVGLARSIGLPIPDGLLALGDDGCNTAQFKTSPELWPEVRHFATAELRLLGGLDPEPVGLGDGVVARFDDVAEYRHNP